MADDTSVEVKIVGSLDSSLQSSTAAAKAQLDGLAKSSGTVRVSAAEMAAALQATGNNLAHVTPEMVGLGAASVSAAGAAENMAASGIKAAAAAETLGHGTAGVTREVIVLAHEMVQGRFSRVPGSIMVLTERMGGLSLATLTTYGSVLAMGGALAYLTYESIEAEHEVEKLASQFVLTGRGADVTKGFLEQWTGSNVKLFDTTQEVTKQILQFEAADGKLNATLMESANQLIPMFVKQYGSDAPKAMQSLLKSVDDLTESGLKKLDREMLNLSPAQYEMISNLIETGHQTDAAQQILEILAERGGVSIKSLTERLSELEAEAKSLRAQFASEQTAIEGTTWASRQYLSVLEQIQGVKAAIANQKTDEDTRGQKEADDLAADINKKYDERAQILEHIKQLQNAPVETPAIQEALVAQNQKLAKLDEQANEKSFRDFQQKEEAKAEVYKAGSAQRIAIEQDVANKAAQLFGTESVQYQQAMSRMSQDRRTAADQQLRASQEADRKFLEDVETTASQVNQILQRDVDAANRRGKSALDQKRRDLDLEVARRQISADDELGILIDLYNKEADLEISRLKAHQQANADDVKVYDEDAQKILATYQWLFDEIAKLQRNSVTQQEALLNKLTRDYEKAFRPITQGFNTMIRGMISGQQTFGQAVRAGLSQLLEDFIMYEVKQLEHYIITQLAMTAAQEAGDASRLASHEAAQAEGSAADAAAGSAQILNDAYKAAAGAYQAVVGIPVVGPVLAPIAAGVAFAAVSAFDVLTSAEGGAWEVGGGFFRLHERESVIPAYIASPMRDFFENGNSNGQAAAPAAPNVTLAISAVDGPSVQRLLKRRTIERQIARQVGKAFTLSPSTRGAF